MPKWSASQKEIKFSCSCDVVTKSSNRNTRSLCCRWESRSMHACLTENEKTLEPITWTTSKSAINHLKSATEPCMQFQSIPTETELVVNEPDQGKKIELDVQKKFKMWSYPSDEKPTSANTGYTSCIYKCASFLRLPRFRFLSFRFGFNVGFRFGSVQATVYCLYFTSKPCTHNVNLYIFSTTNIKQ